jgi:hypothetical protein
MEQADDRARVGGVKPVAGVPARGRGAVAASILGVLLIGGYFAAAPGGLGAPVGEYLLNAGILTVAFWFPAMRVASARDVLRQWKGFLLWILVWAVVWDLATSGILLRRELFDEWWIVYPAAVLSLFGLLLLHGSVVRWTVHRR